MDYNNTKLLVDVNINKHSVEVENFWRSLKVNFYVARRVDDAGVNKMNKGAKNGGVFKKLKEKIKRDTDNRYTVVRFAVCFNFMI